MEEAEGESSAVTADKKILIPPLTFNADTPKRKLRELMQTWFQEACGKR